MTSFKIKKISLQKNRERVNLDFGGGRVFGVSAAVFYPLGLRRGTAINNDSLLRIFRQDLVWRGKDKTLRLLSLRPQSVFEIKSKLSKYIKEIASGKRSGNIAFFDRNISWQPVTAETVEKVISWLEEKKLIDDLSFCRWWIDQRNILKPSPKRMIFWQLRKKGIEKEVIDQALSFYQFDELYLAKNIVDKKIKNNDFSGVDRKTIAVVKNKIFRHLSSKGFSYETIKKAIDGKIKFK